MMTNHKLRLNIVLLAALGVVGCSRGPKDVALVERGKQFMTKQDYARAALQFRAAAQANPKSFDAYYLLASAELARDDKIAAYRALTKALDLNPRHPGANLQMANLLLTSSSLDEVREAQVHAQAVLEGAPDDPDALDAMATAALRLGDRDKALGLLNQASSAAPEHIQTAVALSLLKLAKKDTSGAEDVLKQAVEKAPDSVPGRVVLGAFYLSVGKLQAGEQQLRIALQKDQNNSLALFVLASTLRSAGRNPEAEEIYRRLANGAASPYQSVWGSYLLRSGRQNEAIAEFERLAKLNPKDVNARTRLVAAYIASQRPAAAQQVLDATLRKNPKDIDALLQRSELRLMAGANEDARTDLHQVLHFVPDSAQAHFFLSRVEAAERATLKQRQELNDTLRIDPRFFAARIVLANSYIVGGNGRAALDLMNGTPADQKNTLGYVEYRNWALLASGDLNELQKGIDAGLKKARTHDLLMQDALLQLRRQNDTAARSRLLEILKSNPEDLGAVDVLIRSYAARKQFSAAIEKVRALIMERPQSAPLQYRLGALLTADGRPKEARSAYTAALATNPQFPPPRLALAALDLAEGQRDTARQELDNLLSSKTGELPARMELGFIEAKAGNYAKAIEHLRKVVAAEPTNVVALNNLAYLLADHTDQADEALKLAQKAKELAPYDVNVEGTLGWAYFRKGMYELAVTHLKDAVSRENNNVMDGTAIRRYHLAMAYGRTGDEKNATKALAAALHLDPNLPEAQAAKSMLGSEK